MSPTSRFWKKASAKSAVPRLEIVPAPPRGAVRSREEVLVAHLEAKIEEEQRNRCIESAFWRGEVRDAVRQGELAILFWQNRCRKLRALLEARDDQATHKHPDTIPGIEVSRRIRAKRRDEGLSQKKAEIELAEELGVSDRTVRRRLKEFRASVRAGD